MHRWLAHVAHWPAPSHAAGVLAAAASGLHTAAADLLTSAAFGCSAPHHRRSLLLQRQRGFSSGDAGREDGTSTSSQREGQEPPGASSGTLPPPSSTAQPPLPSPTPHGGSSGAAKPRLVDVLRSGAAADEQAVRRGGGPLGVNTGSSPRSEDATTSDADEGGSVLRELRKLSPTGDLVGLLRSQRDSSRDDSGASAPTGTAAKDTETEDDAAAAAQAAVEKDVVLIMMHAVNNCKPMMKVKQFKMNNKIVYVPQVISTQEATGLAVRWIVEAARKRKEGSKAAMHECLALEMLLAYQKKGSARQKRDDVHKLALENRANVTLKWWK